MREEFTKERLFLLELPKILYDLHQEVLRGDNVAFLQVLQKRLLAIVGGKLSFFLNVERDQLLLDPKQICSLEGVSEPGRKSAKLAEGIEKEFSQPVQYELWEKQIFREPHSIFYDREKLRVDPILSKLVDLGVKACIRTPIMVKWAEDEPSDVVGVIMVVTDTLDEAFQEIGAIIADGFTAAESLLFTIELQRIYEKQRVDTYSAIIGFLVSALDRNDPFIRGHSKRVKDICLKIVNSEKWKEKLPTLSDSGKGNLEMAAELHDVGKLRIAPRVAFKSGKLTLSEEQEFKLHPTRGANFARNARLDEQICLGIRYHHKDYNGRGYPSDNIKGNQIPIFARIISVACAFDNAYSEKGYRIKSGDAVDLLWDLETAFERIEKLKSEEKLDPDIVEVLLDVYENGSDDEKKYVRLIVRGNKIVKDEGAGTSNEALKCYEEAWKVDPENLGLYMFLADFASGEVGDLNQAIDYCRKAIERDATFARAHYEHARLLTKLAKFEDALKACDYATTLVPSYIEAHLEKGRILRRMAVEYQDKDDKVRCYNKAMECFEKVLGSGVLDLEAHLEIAMLLKEQGKLGEALSKCDEILGIDDMCAEAYILKSSVYRDQGRIDDAAKAFEAAQDVKRWEGKEEYPLRKIIENVDRILKEPEKEG